METDEAWLAQVRTGHPAGAFGQREHLRLAWLVLDGSADVGTAQAEVSGIIRTIAHAQGVPQRYHRTVTDAWVRIVSHCRSTSNASSFDALLEVHPWLLDKRALMKHYTSRRLASKAAREQWVEPDLRAIPVG